MSQNSWEAALTALALEASEGLRALAGPSSAGDRVKTRIARAARRAGLPYWRAFDLWYAKTRRVEAVELEAIRAARAARLQEEARDEYELLLARIAACEAALGLRTSDRARSGRDALGEGTGGVDRALARSARDLTARAVHRRGS